MDESKTRSWKNLRHSRIQKASGLLLGGAPAVAESPPAAGRQPDETSHGASEQPRAISGTFIDTGAVFEGTLELTGDFRIDAEFRGELATDGEIVVGPNGSVEGNIKARQVVIQGAVVGNVTARRLLILRAGCRLHGEVETACFEVERHAFFQGATRMTRPQAASLASQSDASQSTAATGRATASAPRANPGAGTIATT